MDRHIRIVAGDGEGESPGLVLRARLLAGFGRDVGNLGKIGGEHVHVFQGEANGPARLLTTGLMEVRPGTTITSLVPKLAKMLAQAWPKPLP